MSGKGIPAALFMAVTVSVLRTLARQIAEPDEILRRLNDELAEQNPRAMFVTLQCLVFDLEHERVSCATAGHHQLALVSPGRAPRLCCPASGRPAGLWPHNPIESETFPLVPGDTFVLFSDGVSEAMNREEDFYGDERLLATLATAADATPAETVMRVLEDVRAFAAGAKQSDDITLVAVQYRPRPGDSRLRSPSARLYPGALKPEPWISRGGAPRADPSWPHVAPARRLPPAPPAP